VGEADERVGRSVRRGVGRDDVHDYDHDDRGTPGASSGSEALDAASEAALADGDAPSDGVDAEPSGEDLAPMRDAGTPHVVARPIPKREGPPPTVQEFAIELAQALRDDKCEDVQLLDVRTIRDDVDFIVIASGTSDRQMRSVLRHAKDLGASCGWHSVRSNADERATWLLADFVGVIVHLFEPSTRAHYDLEMLWGDAPRIAWERPDQAQRDLAGLTPRARR
jgi:ribosome-associated protein